jgi:hypothetical protein
VVRRENPAGRRPSTLFLALRLGLPLLEAPLAVGRRLKSAHALVTLAAGVLLGGGLGATVGGARGAMAAPEGSRELGAWRGAALGVVTGLAAPFGLLYLWWTGVF